MSFRTSSPLLGPRKTIRHHAQRTTIQLDTVPRPLPSTNHAAGHGDLRLRGVGEGDGDIRQGAETQRWCWDESLVVPSSRGDRLLVLGVLRTRSGIIDDWANESE